MCRCINLEGGELVKCLAPPPGDHEVYISVSRDKSIVINSQVIGLRTIIVDETLPFINTYTRPISLEHALKLSGLTMDEVICLAIESLKKAARSGSVTAWRRINECRSLIEGFEGKCGGG